MGKSDQTLPRSSGLGHSRADKYAAWSLTIRDLGEDQRRQSVIKYVRDAVGLTYSCSPDHTATLRRLVKPSTSAARREFSRPLGAARPLARCASRPQDSRRCKVFETITAQSQEQQISLQAAGACCSKKKKSLLIVHSHVLSDMTLRRRETWGSSSSSPALGHLQL